MSIHFYDEDENVVPFEEEDNFETVQYISSQPSTPEDCSVQSYASENENLYMTSSTSTMSSSTLYNPTADRSPFIYNQEVNYQPYALSQLFPLIESPQWNPNSASLMTDFVPYQPYMPCIIQGLPYFMQPNWNQQSVGNLSRYMVAERIIIQNSGQIYSQESYRIFYSGTELPANNYFASENFNPMQDF